MPGLVTSNRVGQVKRLERRGPESSPPTGELKQII
jgi:hypothetical protein